MCHPDVPEGTELPVVQTREEGIPCEDGRVMPSFLALPATSPAPAVLVISDAMGRAGFYEHLSGLLAEAGFVGCAVDYFFRTPPLADAEPETRRLRRKTHLDEQQVLRDLCATLDHLAALPEVAGRPMAAIGFCMGGTLSLDLAALWPRLGASVSFYGYPVGEPGKALVPPPRPMDITAEMRAPVLGHWGDQDPAFDAAMIAEFDQRLEAAGLEHAINVYPGIGHGFLRPFLEDESAEGHATAVASWQTTLEFLRRHLSVGSEAGA